MQGLEVVREGTLRLCGEVVAVLAVRPLQAAIGAMIKDRLPCMSKETPAQVGWARRMSGRTAHARAPRTPQGWHAESRGLPRRQTRAGPPL